MLQPKLELGDNDVSHHPKLLQNAPQRLGALISTENQLQVLQRTVQPIFARTAHGEGGITS